MKLESLTSGFMISRKPYNMPDHKTHQDFRRIIYGKIINVYFKFRFAKHNFPLEPSTNYGPAEFLFHNWVAYFALC